MGSEEDWIQIDWSEFDRLFGIHLGPLKSENTRNIFRVIVEERATRSLTTLDIQAKLEESGVELSKKEINGWLRSLQDAGLVSKGAERGKPTTIEYYDKYTFDLWHLTDLGLNIVQGLPNLLNKRPEVIFEKDAISTMKALAMTEATSRERRIRCLDEVSTLVKVLLELLDSGGELEVDGLMRRLRPDKYELKELLSYYSNPNSGLALIVMRQTKDLRAKLMEFLGLSPKMDVVYALSSEGRRMAQALSSGVCSEK